MEQPILNSSLAELIKCGVNFNVWGDLLMDNSRKSGDLIGNKFGDNIAFQSDNVTQTKTISSGEFSNSYANLLKDIQSLNDQSQKEQALFIAEQLKAAYENNNTENTKTPIKLLKGILGDIGSVASIASICGFTL